MRKSAIASRQMGVEFAAHAKRNQNALNAHSKRSIEMNHEITTQPRQHFDLSPQTFEQALTFAGYLADSDMVPKDFKGKPGNCLVAIQWGMEIGLKPLQAMQNIAVINGRPSLWGDAVIALVRSSPVCEYVIETQNDTSATCRVKRRGEPEQERTFTRDDAKAAGLLGKQGPWSQYPKRMMQMRARAFAVRDVFPDVLKGLPVAEEIMDMPKDMGMAEMVREPAPAQPASRPALEAYPQDRFDANLPKWRELVQSGQKSTAQIMTMVSTRASLSAEQQRAISQLDVVDAEPTTPEPRNTEPADMAEHADFLADMEEGAQQ